MFQIIYLIVNHSDNFINFETSKYPDNWGVPNRNLEM